MKRVWAAAFVQVVTGRHHQPVPSGANDNHRDEAARQLVERYAGLLASGRFADARKYWSDDGRASGLTEAEFAKAHRPFAVISAEVGPAGEGGAWADSSLVDVPLRLSGMIEGGAAFELAGSMTLRRVADNDRASATQRCWQIVRSGLKRRPLRGGAI
ncbi:MAG: hypothetical protein M3Q57_00740 [Pseudomonadota bacterium]|nr:hypothetical protein [Pseudomonadota bacterium]